MGLVQEFKDFAMRGNVVDLAVGVIIGGAFGKIVTSLVNNIFMPVISAVSGDQKVDDLWKIPLGKGDGAVLSLGAFVQTIIDFLLVAICLFLVIKLMNTMKKKAEAAPASAPPEDVLLLREIRDSLSKSSPRRAE
jgi:large conductance mechanosensitive channel